MKSRTKKKKTIKKKTTSSRSKTKTRTKAKTKTKTKTKTKAKLGGKSLLQAYTQILRTRLLDYKILNLYKQNKVHFQISAEGHEALQVAAANAFQVGIDWFYPYYRDMALCVALGISNESVLLNALNKKDDPNSHGRQMPMHYADPEKRIVSQSSPTGSQYNQAVGCALGAVYEGKDEVVYVSSGEGACSQGAFHEALNWAARDRLPVVFVIQNNNYAISTHISEQLAGGSVYKIASGYENLECHQIDGTDYIESFNTIKKAVVRARKGRGPSLIEAMVPRLQSHSISDNQLKYRTEADLKKERRRDPLEKLKKYLIKNKIATKKELNSLQEELQQEIDQQTLWAEAQPAPDVSLALDFTFSEPNPKDLIPEPKINGKEVYMIDAINHALGEELKRNPNAMIFGQDIAHGKGGVFGATEGLTKKYGDKRVFNSQLAEASITGVATGLATRGLKPIAEIQFGDYIWTGMMQIRNEICMLHYRSRGDFSCPAVIRVAIGGYIHGALYHSQNIEATLAHFPGIYIILPSNATDAKGLLKSAIRANDPVLFLEHKGLYRQPYAKGPEGGKDDLIPIGKAKIKRHGKDLSIITWGALVQKSLLAASELEKQGYNVEVLDLRTIVPLDSDSIRETVKKTGRALIAHEDLEFMGFGSEIAAQITSSCFEYLDAPVARVGMKYCAGVPHSPELENVVLPQTEDVINKAIEILRY